MLNETNTSVKQLQLQTKDWKMVLSPENGFVINDLQFKGNSIWHGNTNDQDIINGEMGRACWLLPFANRLAGGKYTFEGKEYQFPINETAFNNNLHGFGCQLGFDLISESENSAIGQYTYDGKLEYYPFPFSCLIKYELIDHQFIINIEVQNSGETSMPIALGWHPYFKLDHSSIDTCELKVPACHSVEVDKHLIPTGKEEKTLIENKFFSLDEQELDNCFRTIPRNNNEPITLKKDNRKIEIHLDPKEWAFFQLFIESHRKSIAIEPMMGNVNCFQNDMQNVATLEAGQILSRRIVIKAFES